MPPELLILCLCAALVFALLSALISGAEPVLFGMTPFELEKIARRSAELAPTARLLAEHPRRALGVLSLAETTANLPLLALGWLVLREVFPGESFWADALALFGILMLPCDLLPRAAAQANSHRLGRAALRFLRLLDGVYGGVCARIERVEERLPASATAPIRLDTAPSRMREEEISTLIDLKEEEGTLHEAESIVIQQIMRLADKRARDLMTPRVDVFAIPDDLTNEEVVRMVRPKRFRRVPVYGGSVDEVVGVLDVKEFLLDPRRHYTEIMGPPSFIPESMNALQLLKGLLRHPQRMAVVLDEFGGTEGVVTLSDAVEELLADALPVEDAALLIEERPGGLIVASGHARIEDLAGRLGVDIAAPPGVRTINQLLTAVCGGVPKTNSSVTACGVEFDIRRADRRRVREVGARLPRQGGNEGGGQ